MEEKQYRREMKRLIAAENAYLRHYREQRTAGWQEKVQQYVPDTLEKTLQAAFAKAFSVLLASPLTKGEKPELAAEQSNTTSLRRAASRSRAAHTIVSGASGVGMGILGLGLPDIPVFLGILLRNVNATAARYGIHTDNDEERYFLLSVIETALLHGEALREADAALNYRIYHQLPMKQPLKRQIRRTSDALAAELLYLKFLQGIPVVGVIGGVSDVISQKRIAEYAELKYRRRYILRNRENPSAADGKNKRKTS